MYYPVLYHKGTWFVLKWSVQVVKAQQYKIVLVVKVGTHHNLT